MCTFKNFTLRETSEDVTSVFYTYSEICCIHTCNKTTKIIFDYLTGRRDRVHHLKDFDPFMF